MINDLSSPLNPRNVEQLGIGRLSVLRNQDAAARKSSECLPATTSSAQRSHPATLSNQKSRRRTFPIKSAGHCSPRSAHHLSSEPWLVQEDSEKPIPTTELSEDAESLVSLHLHKMSISERLRLASDESNRSTAQPTARDQAPVPEPSEPFRVSQYSRSSYSSHYLLEKKTSQGLMGLDGSGEGRLPLPRASSARSSASVGANHQESAQLWEKALNDYQDAQNSSIAAKSGRLSHFPRLGSISGRKLSEVDPLLSEQSVHRRSSTDIHFKPLNTEFTFDKLEVLRTSFTNPAGLQLRTRQSSIRQSLSSIAPEKHVAESASLASTHRHSLTTRDSVVLREKVPGSSEKWSRFPSRTRAERNGSAGRLDDVYVCDFETVRLPSASSCGIEVESMAGAIAKSKAKRRRIKKIRNVLLKSKVMADIPRFFSIHSTNFHRPHRGHRTSISTGGDLEYPELEMLPAVGVRHTMITDLTEPFALNTSSRVGGPHRPHAAAPSPRREVADQ